MKKKFLPLLLALALNAQHLSACEWCGHKNAQHGIVLNTLTSFAYILRSFLDLQGFGNHEDNRQCDDSIHKDEEGLPPMNDTQTEERLMVLAPRGESNLAALITAAEREQIILAVDESMYDICDGAPARVEGRPYYGLENPIAYRLSIVLCARALLNLDLEQLDRRQHLRPLLEQLFERIEAMEYPYTDDTDRTEAFQSLFDMSKHWIERLDAYLPRLWAEHDTLPEEQQIPQADRDFLEEPATLDSTWTLMLARCWRNFFMVGHLKTLKAYAQDQRLPIVALVGEGHIEDLQERLSDTGITSTTDTNSLKLEDSLSER